MRIVLDTNTLISALLFKGQTAYLVDRWKSRKISVLTCEETLNEFTRVLHYPKFKLSSSQIKKLIDYYVPYIEKIAIDKKLLPNDFPQCRDTKDQIFLELAYLGKADILISGDEDLLILKNHFSFIIETPSDYKQRLFD
jgi:putative PIN family toxin of toxin-antitoxin system